MKYLIVIFTIVFLTFYYVDQYNQREWQKTINIVCHGHSGELVGKGIHCF